MGKNDQGKKAKSKFIAVVTVLIIAVLILSSFSMALGKEPTRIPPPGIYWIDISENLIYENNGSLAEYLEIVLDIFGAENEYELSATLYGPNWEYVASFNDCFELIYDDDDGEAYLQFMVDFDGSEINASNIDGPYMMEMNIETLSSYTAPYYDFYITENYTASQFVGSIAKVATPVMSPAGGTYANAQNITISCATVGATILYSTDGSPPYLTYNSPINISSSTTLKAKAVLAGMADSAVSTDIYTITQKVATPISSLPSGTYSGSQSVALSCETLNATIRYTTNGSEPNVNSTLYSSPIIIESATNLKVKAFKAGMVDSDTSSYSYTIKVATPTASPTGGTYQEAQFVSLQCSTAALIMYTTDGSDPKTNGTMYLTGTIPIVTNTVLKAYALRANLQDSDVMTEMYNFQTTVPVASPSGGSFSSIQNVTLTSSTVGSSIFYTLDGSTPTTSSTPYVTGTTISITSTKTLKAIAVKNGLANSELLSETYTLNLPKVATPTSSLPSGTYIGNQTANINCATQDAIITFTVDGTDPNINSLSVGGSGAIMGVNLSVTLKMRAFKDGMAESDVATYIYELKVATPIANPPGDVYNSPQNVSLSCSTSSTQIRYTTNGDEPTEYSTLYEGPITISGDMILKAKSFKYGMTASDVLSESYTIMGATKTIYCTNGQEYLITPLGTNMDCTEGQYTLTYDKNRLKLVDFAAQIFETYLDTHTGPIPGTDVNIVSHTTTTTTGTIVFEVAKPLPSTLNTPNGKTWTGIMTVFKFKAIGNGNAIITIK